MNKRVVISIAAIALLALVLVVKKVRFASAVPDLARWAGEADEIIIESPGGKTRLHKKDGKWVVGDAAYAADKNIVTKLENALRDIELTDLISEKPHLERFDLATDKARRVVATKDNKTVRDLLLGKKSSTQRHTYVKLAERPEVFLARGPLADDFGKTVDELRDKEIMKIEQNAIESFEIEYKGARLSFSKKTVEVKDEKPAVETAAAAGKDAVKSTAKKKDDKPITISKWTCDQLGGVEPDEGKLNGILSSFTAVIADSFIDKPDSSVMGGRLCSIKLKTGGKNVTLVIVGQEKGDRKRYIATSSESPYVFLLNQGAAERFFVSTADLKKK